MKHRLHCSSSATDIPVDNLYTHFGKKVGVEMMEVIPQLFIHSLYLWWQLKFHNNLALYVIKMEIKRSRRMYFIRLSIWTKIINLPSNSFLGYPMI